MPAHDESASGATTAPAARASAAERGPVPGLALAWCPPGLTVDDRAPLLREVTIGRSSSCTWCIRDRMLSREHLSVAPCEAGRFLVRDLASRNGVHVDGAKIERDREVGAGAVIRAGGCVLVVVPDLLELTPPGASIAATSMAGPFHSGAIDRQLRLAARTGRAVLLEGETGVGKELAARRLHDLFVALPRAGAARTGQLHVHNAACFAGEDDAVGALFGVGKGAFTGVEPRAGALELAQGGTLFLDEAHALPLRAQQALLRFVEDGHVRPLGQPVQGRGRAVDLRLILGTNLLVDRACDDGRLAHDLVARLHRVHLPPLRERRADIPRIFLALVAETASRAEADAIAASLGAELVERLCVHAYRRGNARELLGVAASACARIAEGEDASEALAHAIGELSGDHWAAAPAGPRAPADEDASSYERHRREILDSYRAHRGNLSHMVEHLRASGVPCTRQWLATYLDRWGVRPIPRRR
jgi:DNA-binding NtrC family response regulator